MAPRNPALGKRSAPRRSVEMLPRVFLEEKMETLPFNRRTTLIEYVLVACTLALLITVYFFGAFGAGSRHASPNAGYRDAESEYVGPRA